MFLTLFLFSPCFDVQVLDNGLRVRNTGIQQADPCDLRTVDDYQQVGLFLSDISYLVLDTRVKMKGLIFLQDVLMLSHHQLNLS